jgi:hypothetical protein
VLITLIVVTEIAFWLMLLSGLAMRYGLGRPRMGMALLVATPLVDLALLAATTLDLRRGGDAALPHALAAVYIGVSVAWGRRIVDWTDARFAHRFAGGPAPERSPRTGALHAARERREWLRHLVAWTTGTALLGLGVLLVDDLDRTRALLNVASLWTLVLAIDFLVSFSYTLWPRQPRRSHREVGATVGPARPSRAAAAAGQPSGSHRDR